MNYVSHARTPEELKAEVCSDLRRRLEILRGQERIIARSKAERARLARAAVELIDMLSFWEQLQIIRPQRKRARSTIRYVLRSVTLPHIPSQN